MKIAPISMFWSNQKVNNSKNYAQTSAYNLNVTSDSFVKSVSQSVEKPLNPPKTISFMGYDVHIIDGGKHAIEMAQFTKADSPRIDVKLHRAEDTEDWNFNKPLKNIEEQLKEINKFGLTDENSYVAIPVKISVPLQNLAEQYKQVMGYYLHLRPHTTQTCKKKIMDFLKVLYEEPEKYKKYIRYMDPNNQGIEYAYGIIQEINKLNCKKVYVPAEHPQYNSLNWMAGERGEKPELTNYLATGYDKEGRVHNMLDYIQNEGWYDFNLLALSKAEVVNLKKRDGYSDHIYSAYDTTVNDGARGVYNLSPVRENGRLVGYSYKDTVTNQIPVEDFPYNDEVSEVARFVGKHVDEVVADDDKTYAFKLALENGDDTSAFSDKLYPVWKLFDEGTLYEGKIYDKGDFVDSNLKNYYRRNSHYEIIYPEADCESNGKPSVRGMWGSSYSMLNAIKRDVERQRFADDLSAKINVNFSTAAFNTFQSALKEKSHNNLKEAESLFQEAIEYNEMEGFNRRKEIHTLTYKHLGDVKFGLGDYGGANWCYNKYINTLSKNFLEDYAKDDRRIATEEIRGKIADCFVQLAEIAKRRGEMYPEIECMHASGEVRHLSAKGLKILERRADNDVNIGDIFG